jgi:3-oxoacyl-[acyl-carrier protein] reductase
MDLGLRDRVALVTAASRGLGKAVALRLALEGSRVVLNARNAATLATAAREIEAVSGSPVLPVPGDVADPECAPTLVQVALEHWKRVDILVINAGGPPAGSFLDLRPEDWETASRLTLLSAVNLCYAAIPTMKAQGEGAIVAITSASVKQPFPNLVLSNSLRLGVTGLMKTLADELASAGIRVNCLCPGWTRTTRVEQLLADRAARAGTSPEEEAARIAAAIPLGRMGTPEEFACAVAFLASPTASYITGVSLLVDGGLYRGTM